MYGIMFACVRWVSQLELSYFSFAIFWFVVHYERVVQLFHCFQSVLKYPKSFGKRFMS